MAGDETACDYMVTYNEFDVKLLEEIYMRLRPYDKSHPHLGLYYEDDVVRDPTTGEVVGEVVEGKFAYTAGSAFPVYRGSEGHYFRSTRKVKGVKTTNSQ